VILRDNLVAFLHHEEPAVTVYDFFDGQELTRPNISTAEAAAISAELFGIAGTVQELGSHQDRNFRIDTQSPLGVTSYLLKVDNSAFSPQELLAQDAAMALLSARGLRVPTPIAGVNGRTRQHWVRGDERFAVRMLSFIEGTPMASARSFSPEVVAALGALSGTVARELAGFDAEGLDRSLQWDLRSATRVVDRLIDHVADAGRRDAVLSASAAAAERLARVSERLRVQAIHGDITDDNVMGEQRGGELVPTGVIDFGDLAHGWLVAELAVTLSSVINHVDSLRGVLPAVEAFNERVPLADDEIAALWPLVVLRGAALVVSGEYQVGIDGDNDYAAERTDNEWRLFEAAAAWDWDDAEAAIRSAIAAPAADATLFAGMTASDIEVLDFSVTAPSLAYGRWLEPDAEWELAGEALARARAAAAPFGQYRLTRSRPNSAEETRTLALGWELFAPAGTRVVSPASAAVLRAGEDSLVLGVGDSELVFTGIRPSVSAGERVEQGAAIAELGDQRSGIGRLLVQQARAGLEEAPAFCVPSEAQQWLEQLSDPATLIGLQPVSNPFDPEEELHRRSKIFASAQERYYLKPPQIERGWKEFLVGTDGRVYLDMVNNVAAIGHGHPRQAQAVADQLALLNTNSRFLYRALADLSERLVELAPDPSLDTVLLVNSGTEAIDLALRLAQVYTGRRAVVALREAYHGWSMGADAITTSAYDNPYALANRPDWVEVADIPNPYRGTYRGPDSAPQYLADLRVQLDAMTEGGREPAAFICETLLGNAGGIVMPNGYLAGAYEEIRARGGVAIADEVQVGYGRLGRHFWGVQQQGAVPDVISVAKAMGNGFPLGAVITRREIAEALSREGNFFSSAGGSPASCVAGLAVLDVIRDEGLQQNAASVGDHLVSRLNELAQRHEIIGAVHGMGLYLGVELVRNRQTLEPATEETAAVCEALLQHGVIMQATSERQNVLKVKPPLCLSLESADFFVDALDEVLSST